MSKEYGDRRACVLDTETSGLSPALGDKLVEIGIVELIDRKPTGRVFHEYVDPGFEIPEEAVRIHGLTREAVVSAGKGQVFGDIAKAMLEFIGDSELVIHNAGFDLGFLDAELRELGLPPLTGAVPVVDTLKYASVKHPGQRNTLDALCRRYGVDLSGREVHGALLDASLLAEVYVPLTIVQQEIGLVSSRKSHAPTGVQLSQGVQFFDLPVVLPTAEESAAHDRSIARIQKESKADPLWRTLGI